MLFVINRCVTRLIERIKERFSSFLKYDAVFDDIILILFVVLFKFTPLQAIHDIHATIVDSFRCVC